MDEPEEIKIKIPGKRIAAKAWGPKGGPLVLALHGWLDNAATFDGLAPLLPGLRIVAIDLPGHGMSSHHTAGDMYNFVDLVGDVYWVTESMQWSKFAMLGHSMGAALSVLLAGTYPERVVKLALLEGLGPLTESPEQAPVRLARALTEQRKKVGRPPVTYESPDPIVQRLTEGPSALTRRSAEILLARGLERGEDGRYKWRADRRHRYAGRTRLTEEQVLAFLARIECQTLVVRASEGLPFSQELVDRRAEAVKNLEIVEVKGRHHVHLDYPDRVAPHLQKFFAALVRKP